MHVYNVNYYAASKIILWKIILFNEKMLVIYWFKGYKTVYKIAYDLRKTICLLFIYF